MARDRHDLEFAAAEFGQSGGRGFRSPRTGQCPRPAASHHLQNRLPNPGIRGGRCHRLSAVAGCKLCHRAVDQCRRRGDQRLVGPFSDLTLPPMSPPEALFPATWSAKQRQRPMARVPWAGFNSMPRHARPPGGPRRRAFPHAGFPSARAWNTSGAGAEVGLSWSMPAPASAKRARPFCHRRNMPIAADVGTVMNTRRPAPVHSARTVFSASRHRATSALVL